jgi:hypothetical protein
MKKSIRLKDQLLIFLALLVWLPLSVNAQLTLPDIPSNSGLASRFELSTEMVFRVKKDETYMPNGALIAYINGEIRGAQTTSVIFPSTGIKVYKILVFNDKPSGDSIKFKFYNIVAGKIYDVKEKFEFVFNRVPDYANPIILNARNQVIVQTNPLGCSFSVDGVTYYSPVQTYEWITGSSHVIGTSSPQGWTGGTRYVWQNWNDGGAIGHTVTVPEGTTTYTADFLTQNLLTTSVSPSSYGSITVNPTSPDGYYNSGTSVELKAVPNSGYVFYSWQGDLAGMTNPQSIVMSAPRYVTAVFSIFIPEIEQSINLTEGWNIFSLYVEPTNVDMKTVVQSLISSGYLSKVQDETGAAIENVIPVGWVNFIGDWKPSEGYKIRVTANTQLNVTGYPISNPYSIDLTEGWNIISYPINTSQDALGAVNPLILNSTLVKVQNEAGQAIENVPAIGWINNIDSFDPGEGYKIRVNANDQLVLDNQPGLSPKSTTLSVEHNSSTSHFKTPFQGYGLDHMNIYVSKAMVNNALLEPGDEIAVFDGDICVGKTIVINPEGLISIIASKDDPTTAEADGFIEGHSISFRLWAEEVERELQSGEVEYESGYSGVFEAMGTTVASLKALIDSDVSDNEPVISAKVYPNPFDDELIIEIQNNTKNTNCEILNSSGQIVFKGTLVERIVLQTSDFSPGVYLIKLENDKAFIIRKIVKE